MKVRIRWTETATYEVEIETELTPLQLRDDNDPGEDGSGRWFAEVERAVPDWPSKHLVEVDERDLDEIEIIEAVPAREKPAKVRQTACRHCGLDIEGFAPYRRGEWRDRGSNTHCNDGKQQHAPIRPLNG